MEVCIRAPLRPVASRRYFVRVYRLTRRLERRLLFAGGARMSACVAARDALSAEGRGANAMVRWQRFVRAVALSVVSCAWKR
jgi:hypothetical protein